MNRRILVLLLLLAAGLVALTFTSGASNHVRNRLAYAGLVAQIGNEGDPGRAPILEHYDRTDSRVPAGATILIGDSIAQRAPFAGPCIANRGIGGERSDQLLANLGRWPSLDRAGAVVVAIGTNDVWQRRPQGLGQRVAAILDRIAAPVYLIGLSADLEGIVEANRELRRACRGGCTFIEPTAALAPDGIHLSAEGYERLAAQLPLRCERPRSEA